MARLRGGRAARERRGGLFAVAAAVAALAVVPLGPQAPADAAAQPLPMLLGWGPGSAAAMSEQIPQIQAATGKVPAIGMLPFRVEQDWNATWIKPRLTEMDDFGVVPYFELTTETTETLVELAAGQQDAQLDAMVTTLSEWLNAKAGRSLILAPFPEMNLDHHAWGGRPKLFKQAYHRVRAAFLDAGLTPAQVRFVFGPNGLSSEGFGYPEFYPGDGAVDIVGFAKLNRGDPWRDYAENFQRHLDEMRATVTTTKPILITVTGSVTSGGDRDAWLHDMFTKLEARDDVLGAIYWNRVQSSGGYDFRVLVDGALDPTFKSEYQSGWSNPSQSSYLFDGALDAWVTERGGTPAGRFADAAGTTFEADIEWAAAQQITGGCQPDFYCPGDDVTRGQLATFLTKALDLPPSNDDRFVDDDDSPHEANIQAVAAAGITTGCNAAGDRFCPNDPVTRAQMATFLVKAYSLPSATTSDAFTDDDDSPHEDSIDRLAGAGITQGCTETKFCPNVSVTRGQIAAFLHRADDYGSGGSA